MRFAVLAFSTFVSIAVAAPIPGINQIGQIIEDLIPGDATFEGIGGAVRDSIARPDLLFARIQVVRGLAQTRDACTQIRDTAPDSGNDDLVPLAEEALLALDSANGGVSNIGAAIVAGETPNPEDQATVAQGTFDAQALILQFNGLLAQPDGALELLISDAENGITELDEGVRGVLAASGLGFEDIGVVPPEEQDQVIEEQVGEGVINDDVLLEDELALDDPLATETETLEPTATATESAAEATETDLIADDLLVEDDLLVGDELDLVAGEDAAAGVVEDNGEIQDAQAILDELRQLLDEIRAAQGARRVRRSYRSRL